MKATEAKLLQVLGAVSEFVIPIYQRTYSWTLKECEQLWADILRAGATVTLGMPLAELDDPIGLAKNVAGIGRWGNGEVELAVADLEEVPYALGLIRQSLNRQLDDNGGMG
jgi:predicted transport protein